MSHSPADDERLDAALQRMVDDMLNPPSERRATAAELNLRGELVCVFSALPKRQRGNAIRLLRKLGAMSELPPAERAALVTLIGDR